MLLFGAITILSFILYCKEDLPILQGGFAYVICLTKVFPYDPNQGSYPTGNYYNS